MGGFMAVSAFRTQDADGVLAAAERFFIGRGCSVERIGPAAPENEALQVFRPVDGWTVVLWPNWFSATALAQAISADLHCLASDIDVYDGDLWNHRLVRDGKILDQFCSVPDYFTDDPAEIERFAGRPDLVAAEVGRPIEQISPYFVRLVEDEDDMSPVGKAFPDDQSEIADPDVLFDFWRRLGVHYPHDLLAGIGGLRLAGEWRPRSQPMTPA